MKLNMKEVFNFVFCNKSLRPHSNKALPSFQGHYFKRPDVINTARGYFLSRETSQHPKLNNLNFLWCLCVFNLCISHSICRFLE